MEEEIEIEKQLENDYNFDSDDNIEEEIIDEVEKEQQQAKTLKPVTSADKFNSSAKNAKEWGDYDLDKFDDEDTIDEFIKKHLDEDPGPKKLDIDSSQSDEQSESGLTPKQALVAALLRLPDSDDL